MSASPRGSTRRCFITTPLPKELFRRSLLAPSILAHLLTGKYLLGVPFYRLEQQLELQGASLDRGTMRRYAEDAGATLGAIVEAARREAFETAFCLSTDATGVSIQPGPIQERKDKKPGPCRKGHFFVVLADKDHVFFEYQPKHTSAAVCEMFRGFSGYIQADAHAIYEALFRGTSPRGAASDEERGPPRPKSDVGRIAAPTSGRRRSASTSSASRGCVASIPSSPRIARSRICRPRSARRAAMPPSALGSTRSLPGRGPSTLVPASAASSPPRSATPFTKSSPCGASSTTGAFAWRTIPARER